MFDLYTEIKKDKKKSLTIKFKFNNFNKTLVKDEVDNEMNILYDNLKKKFGAILRQEKL